MSLTSKQYYSISSTLLVKQHEATRTVINEKINLNILLDSPLSSMPCLITKLGSIKNKYIISLCSTHISSAHSLDEWLPKLFILTSLHQFSNENGLILPFFSTAGAAVKSEQIKEYFTDQGVDDMKMPVFNYTKDGTDIQYAEDCSFAIYHPEKVTGTASPRTNGPVVSRPVVLSVIAFTADITDLNVFSSVVSAYYAEEKSRLLEITPDNLSENYIEKAMFEQEKELWKKRALLYQHFLRISKSVQEKEYYEVLNWYQQEYEVLPLWFKRIGHIVKVIMGKRSFKSLFKKNFKKFKV